MSGRDLGLLSITGLGTVFGFIMFAAHFPPHPFGAPFILVWALAVTWALVFLIATGRVRL